MSGFSRDAKTECGLQTDLFTDIGSQINATSIQPTEAKIEPTALAPGNPRVQIVWMMCAIGMMITPRAFLNLRGQCKMA